MELFETFFFLVFFFETTTYLFVAKIDVYRLVQREYEAIKTNVINVNNLMPKEFRACVKA